MVEDVYIAHYIESLARSISSSKPYYIDNQARFTKRQSKANIFPSKPGVYLILRYVNLPDIDYTTRGVNTKSPLILYVGRTTSKRSIKARLNDHFSGGKRLSYQGSQFRKFLYQLCQDHDMVKKILWSDSTRIASVVVEEEDQIIEAVENLAIQIFKPRFNVVGR